MDSKRGTWDVDETDCLVTLWASREIQNQFEGATRTKAIFERLSGEMCTAGFERNAEQISNKLKKLKKEFRDWKKQPGRSGRARKHFSILESILGDKPIRRTTTGSKAEDSTIKEEAFIHSNPPEIELRLDAETKNYWTEEETACLVSLWSSEEVQRQFEGATRTMRIFESLSGQMSAAGFQRSAEQISSKLQNLKKDYRDQKKQPGTKKSPYFSVLDSILGDRPTCQPTSLNSESTLEDSLSQNTAENESSSLLPLSSCSSPSPSVSGCSSPDTQGKRKRTDSKTKSRWEEEETDCLMALWSSEEVQRQFEGKKIRTKDIIERLSEEMCAAGFNRSAEQISNKLHNLKKELGDQMKMKTPGARRGGSSYFSVLDSILGDRPTCQPDTQADGQTERDTQTDGQGERDTQTDRQRERDTQADRQRERDTQTDRQRERDRPTCTDTQTDTQRERDTQTDRQRERDRHTCQSTGPLNQPNPESTLEDSLIQNTPENDLSALPPSSCSSPSPSDSGCSSPDTPGRTVMKRLEWGEEETECLVSLWSSEEVQRQFEGGMRRKKIFERLSGEMSAAGFQRSAEQISNKLKKLKRDYRDQRMKQQGTRKSPHATAFESLIQNTPDIEVRLDSRTNTQWTEEETACLVSLWSSEEVQRQFEGATRTMRIFESLSGQMSAAGFQRSAEQISNKLKKLKKDYRDRKQQPGRTWRPRKNPHFSVLDSILGDRPTCQPTCLNTCQSTGTLNHPNPLNPESTVEDSLSQNTPEIELSSCSSPSPSVSGCSSPDTQGKRKRVDPDLMEYLKRTEERHLQAMEESRIVNRTLLQEIKTTNAAMLGLMERMVAAMEAKSKSE